VKRTFHISFIPWRFYLLLSIILLVVFGLIARLVDLTILNRGFLQHQGDVRVLRVVNTPAFRGMITDRNNYPLAVSTSVYSIWVNPHDFGPATDNLKSLAMLLGTKSDAILAQIQHDKAKHREFIYLKRGVSPELAARIKKLKIVGLFLQEEYKRYYPEAEVAAHVVGFTNVDDKGQEGLELTYNQWLTGAPGKKMVVKDRLGRSISDVQLMQEQKPGSDLVLSMDRRIQYLAYRELMEGVEKNVAASGSVVVLDVKTGEILAMVNQPSFNPNNRPSHNSDIYRNRAVTDTFEPGSTIKAFSIATALDSGKFKPDSQVDTAPGWMRVGRSLVRDEHDNGVISIAQILQLSSNVGVTKVILSLPPEQLYGLLRRVGFGETTNVGFPGEQGGSLVKRAVWKPFAVATLAFGYGISVTPLQLAQAYSIFANKGMKIPTSLLKLDKPPVGEQIIDPKIAADMLALLETVTTAKGATGNHARVPGYRVAGKTGTAAIAGAHGYEKHRFTSSFVGIAPVTNPRLVVAVIIHDPQGKYHLGGTVSAPVFEKIMEGALRILNVPPDNVDDVGQAKDTGPLQQVAAKPRKKVFVDPELDPFDSASDR
jgi:cell division protein FtsI (penicillin-binding protein 3)